MADVPKEVCAFCEEGEEAGSLRKTSDDRILAHYNCLLFSPGVITRASQDLEDTVTKFDIPSVKTEIKRGRKLICSYKPCKIKGATIGCDIKKCRRTYHYKCVIKDGGKHVYEVEKETFIAYCFKHKHSENNQDGQNCQLDNGSETSVKSTSSACSNKSHENKTPKKRRKKMKHTNSDVRKRLRFEDKNVPGTVENVRYNSEGARRPSNQLPDNHTNEEDREVPGPSWPYQQRKEFHILTDSESDRELPESDDSHSSQIRTGQNGGMRVKRKQSLSDHADQEDMEAEGSCAPMPNHGQKPIVIRSDSESEEDFPAFNGSQLVSIKRESNLTIDDASGTPVGGLNELLSSTPREGTPSSGSSTDCGDPSVPKIRQALSLSGFPKKNKIRTQKRDNPQLDTSLVTMNSDERDVYSQLYDEVGGSFPMSQDIPISNDCDDEQTEDSVETLEDTLKDQHTGTNERSDGDNLNIAASDSPALIQTPEDQFDSSTHENDATSISQHPRLSPGVTNSSSGLPVSMTKKVQNADNLRGTILHPVYTADGSEELAFASGEILTSVQPINSADGENDTGAQSKDISNGKDKLDESSSAIYHNPTEPLDDQSLRSRSTNKSFNKEQLINTLNMSNISNEQHNNDNTTKDSLQLCLGKLVKKHEACHSNFPMHASGKGLGFANTDMLSVKESVGSPSVSQTSNEQPINPQFTSSSPEEHSPGISKTSDEWLKACTITTRALVHAVNSHNSELPEDQTAEVLKTHSQPEAHLSASTNGTDIQRMATNSPRASTSREETPPTSPDIRGNEASEVQNETCLFNPRSLKAFSAKLKQGAFHERFSKPNAQMQSARKFLMTSPNSSHCRDDHIVPEPAPDPSIFFQPTQNYLTNVDENPRNSDHIVPEPAPDPSIVFQPTQNYLTNVDENPRNSDADDVITEQSLEPSIAPQSQKCSSNLNENLRNAGQTEDEPPSTGDIVEDEPMLVEEEITHPGEDPEDPFSDTTNAAVLTANCSQTEISYGFPANVNKPVNLNFDQKSQLMESYKETEKQMSRTGDMEAGAAKAFWDLCQENKCRELLLTLVTCCIKSILHKIVHEEPEDRDFEQAFAFLQASGGFADFINRTEDDQAEMNSRIGIKEPNNRKNPDNVGFCTEVAGQGKFTRDEDPDKMEPDIPETTSINNNVLQYARDEDHNEVNAECSKTSSLSVSNKVKESSIDEDHRRMQSKSLESSSKSSRKEISRAECNDGMQPDLSKSSSESSRKEESSGDKCHDGKQHDLPKSSSKRSRKEESSRDECHDGKQHDLSKSCSESSRNDESARDECHDGKQHDLSKSCSESSRNEESARDECHDGKQHDLPKSSSKRSRKEESSRDECHDGKQHDLPKSSSKRSRKEGSSRDECHDGMQHDLSKSSSESSRNEESAIGEDLDRTEMELTEASLFTPSVSSKSDLTLAKNTSRGPLTSEKHHNKILKTLRVVEKQQQIILLQHQQQTEDGDAAFATNLVKYLRKVPEDKMLDTQIGLLSVLSSVLDQKPMSTLNPGCVPKQYTNTSTPSFSGQTPKP